MRARADLPQRYEPLRGLTLAEFRERRLRRRRRGGRRGDQEGGEGVPVDPDRPNHLSGGAAAALEFDA